MNYSKILLGFSVIFCLIILHGCEKDVPVQPVLNETYRPYLYSQRGDRQIILKWGWSTWGLPTDPERIVPESFEILISDKSPSKLHILATVDKDVTEFTLGELTNGASYYFAIRSLAKNAIATISNTIMAVPDNPENVESVFSIVNSHREMGTWSPDGLSVAYMGDYEWSSSGSLFSTKSVFVYSLISGVEQLLELGYYSPDWSPVGQKIVFHTDRGEINEGKGIPAHIAVYDLQGNVLKKLTSGNIFNSQADWSPDGEWIVYLSDVQAGNEYHIWKIVAEGDTAIQLTFDSNDLNDLGLKVDRSPVRPVWTSDGNGIAFARYKKVSTGYVRDIFFIPANGGNATAIVESPWNDYAPSFSPDGSKIAFISDRSGLAEIWTMDLQSKTLRQITGSSEKGVKGGWGKIEWSLSSDKILFTGYSDIYRSLFVVDVR